MTVSQLNRFCGNPQNHEYHSWGDPVPFYICDGVGIEKEDVLIEKYEPSEMAEDGTAYSEVTVVVKDKDGHVTLIYSEKASAVNLDVEYQKYVPLDQGLGAPHIERAVLSWQPYWHSDAPITITNQEKVDET